MRQQSLKVFATCLKLRLASLKKSTNLGSGHIEDIVFLFHSAGRRSCPGEGLAKMELFIFLTHLLHRFTFKKSEEEVLSLEPNVRGSSTPTDYKIQAIKRY